VDEISISLDFIVQERTVGPEWVDYQHYKKVHYALSNARKLIDRQSFKEVRVIKRTIVENIVPLSENVVPI
jgi:hypothetical protein